MSQLATALQKLNFFKLKKIFCSKRDNWDRELFLENAKDWKDTLTIIGTDKNHILGFYSSEPWRNGWTGLRFYFFFYFSKNKLKVCFFKKIWKAPMYSSKDIFMYFDLLIIWADRRQID
jgi:hypothetical protein